VKTSELPALRQPSPESTSEALGKVIAQHNRRALLIAAFTAFVAAGLWLLLYTVSCWMILFALSASDAPVIAIPRGFGILFAIAAICAIAYAWLDRRLTPDELPRDDKSPGEILSDIILALPRITLSVWGTLRAWLHMDRSEREIAAEFLHRLVRERRIPLHSAPQDIPDAAMRFRILFALQITEIIDLRRDDRGTWVVLNPSRPRTLKLGQRGT
jgi:hypothetical protein